MQSTKSKSKSKLKSVFAIAIAAILLSGLVTIVQPTAIKAQGTSLQVTADDIQRGNTQTLKIQADSPGSIIGILTYPSGHQVFMQGETDENGALDYSFKIGGNTKPGTFTVDILAATDAGRASGSTTFEVSPKGALLPPGEIPVPPVENTTTAPEEPVVIAPENETSVVTEDNASEAGIEIPIENDTIVIPSNETTVPDAVDNDTEVIIAPEEEVDIITEENATEVQEIPDEVIENITEDSVLVPGNETTVTENVTVSEPTLPDLTPIDNETSAGNVTDIVVVPPSENVTEAVPPEELPPELSNITEGLPPAENVTEAAPPGETGQPETEVCPPVCGNETTEPEAGTNVTVTEPENATVTEPENVTTTEPENVTITEPENVTVTEPEIEAPGNVTIPTEGNVTIPEDANVTVVENATTTEPEPEPTPELPFLPENETAAPEANVTEEAPEAPTNVTVEAPTEGNVTVETPESNVTVTEPEPTTPNGTTMPEPEPETPAEAIDVVEEATDNLDQAVDSGNVDEIIAAMQKAITAQQVVVAVVDTATEDERDAAESAVNDLNDLIKDAFNEVSESD
jgi:hypothetical protein